MKKYQLIFPTTQDLKNFLEETDRPGFRKDFPAKTLYADLTDSEKTLAIGSYNAIIEELPEE